MSKVQWSVAPGPVALSAATAKTVLQLVAAANHRAIIREMEISFDGTSNSATPVKCEIVRQTDAGTMSAATLSKINSGDDETLQTSGQHTATAEPTTTDVLQSFNIHPQSGRIWQAIYDGEIPIKGGERLGIRITAPATVNANVTVRGEE